MPRQARDKQREDSKHKIAFHSGRGERLLSQSRWLWCGPLSLCGFTQSRSRMFTYSRSHASFALIRCGYGLTAADTTCSDGADDTNLEYHWDDFKRVAVATRMLTACDSNGDGKISWDEFFEKVRKQQLFPPLFILKMISLPRQTRDEHIGRIL
eukprot:COSAG06_NODE_4449_length_4252_cov_21.903443_4_plen_154_part_00